jgi:hypothetical protein
LVALEAKLLQAQSHKDQQNMKIRMLIEVITQEITQAQTKLELAKAAVIKYKKFYEKMANHKIDQDATKMDMKRYPYARHVKKSIESNRYAYTLAASGPYMLAKVLTRFVNRNKNKAAPNTIQFNNRLGNVKVRPNTDTNWMTKTKPTSFKGMSFDEDSIPARLFSKRKNKEKTTDPMCVEPTDLEKIKKTS